MSDLIKSIKQIAHLLWHFQEHSSKPLVVHLYFVSD